MHIAHHESVLRFDLHLVQGKEESLRVWFAQDDVIGGDYYFKVGGQAVELHNRVNRSTTGGDNAHAYIPLLQLVQCVPRIREWFAEMEVLELKILMNATGFLLGSFRVVQIVRFAERNPFGVVEHLTGNHGKVECATRVLVRVEDELCGVKECAIGIEKYSYQHAGRIVAERGDGVNLEEGKLTVGDSVRTLGRND